MMPLDPVLRENTSPDSGILSQDDSTYGGSANTNPLEPIKLSNDCKFLLTVKSAVEANELKRKNETIDLTGIEPENKKRRRPPKKDWREHFVQSPPKDVEAATETEKTKSEKLSRVANTANSTTASLNTVNVNENDKSPFYGHVPPSICRTDTSTVVHKSNLVQITEMLLGIASSSCVKQEYSHLSIPKPTVIRSSPDLKLRQAKSLTSKKEVKSNLPDRLSATSAAITVSSSTASSNAVKSKEEDDTELCDIMKSVNASITSQFSAKTTDFRANSTNSIWRTPQKNSNHCADTNSESKKRPKMKEPGNKCSDAEKRSKSKTKSKNKSKNKSVSDRKMEMKKPKSKPKSSVIKKNTVQEKVETVEDKPASLRRSTPAPSSAAKEQKPLKPKGMKHKKGKKKSKKMDKKKKIVEKDKTRLPPEFGAKVDSLAVSLTLLKISVNTVKRRTGSQVPPEIFRKRVYHVVKNQKKKRHTEEDSYLKVMQLKRKKPQASQTKKGKQPDTVEAVKVINGQPEELISKPASDTRKRKRISPPVDDVVPKTNGIAADTPVAEVVESTVRRRSTSTANGAPAKNKKKSSVVSSTKSLTGKIKNSRKKEDSKPPGKDGKNAVTVTEVVNGKASNSTKPRESRRKSRAPVKAKITTVTKTKKPKPEPPREEVLAEKEVEPEIFLWITKPTVSTGSRTKIAKLPKVVKDVVSIPSKDFMEAGLLSSFFKRDGIDVTSDESPPIKVEDTACLPDEKTVEEANACNNLKEDVKQEAKAENGLEKSSATNEKTEDVVEVEEEEVLKIVDRMMPSYSHHDLSMSLGEFKLPYDVWLSESPSNRDVKNVEKNYTKIRSNTFSDPEFKPVGEKAHSCTCKPPNDPKKLGCDYDSNCLNRAMQIECSQSCPCKERCNNQKMRQHKWAPGLQRIMTRNRGWGVRTMDPIKKGQFVLEYIGEVVTADKFQGRMMNEYKDDPHHYCLFLDSYLVIDGYRSANEGRFVNHSCEPNCQMQKWSVSGLYRVGLFANRDIKPGEELSYDYNFHSYNSESQQACLCGSEKCRGVIGGRVKPNGEKPGKEIGLTGRNRRRLLINHLQPHTKFVEQFQQHTEKFAMKKLGPKLCNLYRKKRIFLIRNYENLRQKEVAWLDGMKVKDDKGDTVSNKRTRLLRDRKVEWTKKHGEWSKQNVTEENKDGGPLWRKTCTTL
ncbi:Histone-lysine N-methyltransferase ASH1L [Halotydeus destructor]|nr:Histone-lysine N-methyltransferase ASH1L [Halotydeus destructor]